MKEHKYESTIVLRYECDWCGKRSPEARKLCIHCSHENPWYEPKSAFNMFVVSKKSAIDNANRTATNEEEDETSDK